MYHRENQDINPVSLNAIRRKYGRVDLNASSIVADTGLKGNLKKCRDRRRGFYPKSTCTFFCCSTRDGGKGLFASHWPECCLDGLSGGQLDFYTDFKTQRTKP